jgi:hypothetical protein
MKTNRRVMTSLAGGLLICGVLVAVSSGAVATASAASTSAAGAGAADALIPPTLTSATRQVLSDGSLGDEVRLVWAPSATVSDTADYAVYANGQFVFRTGTPQDVATLTGAMVFLTSEGLTGTEAFSVLAEDSAGNQSQPSNSLVPSPAVTLPAPVLTSAVINGDMITLSWQPSHTDEVSGTLIYTIIADTYPNPNGCYFTSVTDATSITVPVTNYNCDGIDPTTVRPGTLMSVSARDLTFFNTSPLSNALPATHG